MVRWRVWDVNGQFGTASRYAVYKLGTTKCAFARRWASRLSYNKNEFAPLAPGPGKGRARRGRKRR